MLRSDPRLLGLAIALSALAGFVDALGFLSAGGFFVSFMSGNSTRLAVGLNEGSSAALSAGGLILGFIAGVVAGALLGQVAGRHRRPIVLALVTVLLFLAALLAPSSIIVSLGLMVMAMGAENAALSDNGEVRIGLTYMTGALVRLGQSFANRLMGGDASHWYVDLGLWSGLMIGAIAGAGAYGMLAMKALWIAVALGLCLTAATLLIGSSGGRRA